jgi:hypothetical protein
MSTTSQTPLGGFEQRLLSELRAEVASRAGVVSPTPAPRRRVSWRRLPALVTTGIAAIAVALLSMLPAASPSLAQAFPILSEQTHTLPDRFVRLLQAQWHTRAAPRFDLDHAYAFSTPAGTGYVVVDQRSRWLCIFVPGLRGGAASGRCEQVTLARAGRPALTVRVGGHAGQEIVALLPRGARAATATRAVKLRFHSGVVTIASRRPVTLVTTVDGHHSATTYAP